MEAYSYPAIPGLTRAINGAVAGALLRPRLVRFGPDLVIAYWAYPEGMAGVRAAHALGKPCIVGALGTDVLLRSGWMETLTRKTLQRADAVSVVSRDLERVVAQRYGVEPTRIHTIVNGHNTGIFHPQDRDACRTTLGLRADTRLIVFVGRLIEAKGLRELLEAFHRVAAADALAELVIIGDGAMRDTLARLASASDAASRIHLAGALPPERVALWLGACNLLCLPSWSEGHPNVVVEALASGRPVVASDVGGMRELVHCDNGALVPPRDPLALAGALTQALARAWDGDQIASAMRRTWDDVAGELLSLAEDLVSTNPRVGC